MEIWKEINSYEEYQVSNLGRIKSLKYGKEKILSLRVDTSGYLGLRLSKENKPTRYNVHRLVALAFIENPNELPEVDHINRIKTDNRVENLRWASRSENALNTKDRLHSTNYRNICISDPGFKVQIRRNSSVVFQKYCKTLDEAVLERDNFMSTL